MTGPGGRAAVLRRRPRLLMIVVALTTGSLFAAGSGGGGESPATVLSGGPLAFRSVTVDESGPRDPWTKIAADIDGDVDVFGANWSGPHQPVELWQSLHRPPPTTRERRP